MVGCETFAANPGRKYEGVVPIAFRRKHRQVLTVVGVVAVGCDAIAANRRAHGQPPDAVNGRRAKIRRFRQLRVGVCVALLRFAANSALAVLLPEALDAPRIERTDRHGPVPSATRSHQVSIAQG